MEEYKVIIFPAAQNDVKIIAEHLNGMLPEEAETYFEMLVKKAEILKLTPSSCPLAKDSQLRLRTYRILAAEDYLLFFVLNARTVEIRRILYAKRQYERLA